jgi:hypothetical protein
MKPFGKKLSDVLQTLAESKRSIPIDRCYHYRGFRYGGFGNNPYEDYVVGLIKGSDTGVLRNSFAASILTCRPTNMAEAIQVNAGDAALWDFPWSRRPPDGSQVISDPAENPDIVCHYCAKGVLASHINREIRWLERALSSIRSNGYTPSTRGFIRCQEFVHGDLSSYLVLDGNHRVGALHACGDREVTVKVMRRMRVCRVTAKKWPRVIAGAYNVAQALAVFDRYFSHVNPPLRPMHQANLIVDEKPFWRTT